MAAKVSEMPILADFGKIECRFYQNLWHQGNPMLGNQKKAGILKTAGI